MPRARVSATGECGMWRGGERVGAVRVDVIGGDRLRCPGAGRGERAPSRGEAGGDRRGSTLRLRGSSYKVREAGVARAGEVWLQHTQYAVECVRVSSSMVDGEAAIALLEGTAEHRRVGWRGRAQLSAVPQRSESDGGGSEGSDSTPEIWEKYEQRKKKGEGVRRRTILTTGWAGAETRAMGQPGFVAVACEGYGDWTRMQVGNMYDARVHRIYCGEWRRGCVEAERRIRTQNKWKWTWAEWIDENEQIYSPREQKPGRIHRLHAASVVPIPKDGVERRCFGLEPRMQPIPEVFGGKMSREYFWGENETGTDLGWGREGVTGVGGPTAEAEDYREFAARREFFCFHCLAGWRGRGGVAGGGGGGACGGRSGGGRAAQGGGNGVPGRRVSQRRGVGTDGGRRHTRANKRDANPSPYEARFATVSSKPEFKTTFEDHLGQKGLDFSQYAEQKYLNGLK
ncbi:hypothetical protein B0H13DRAFT_1906508 [Mycena leptocephala]|nr:hypothetical protein B0H13DRAFT_1906508 [Mycena leptocephala]